MIAAIFAFIEAKGAKRAALDAGRTVKIQTITIELSEILQRLDKLEPAISYSDARDLLNEIARRLRRLASPFKSEQDLKETITDLFTSLEHGKKALNSVKPENLETEEQNQDTNSVYYATEAHFSSISSYVAELMGLLEKRSIDTGI